MSWKFLFLLLTLPFYQYLHDIGPLFLFCALILGIVGLPIPDELILMASGYLMFRQKIHFYRTVAAALFGALIGITISYLLGRLVGGWIIRKWGPSLHLTEARVESTKRMIYTYGKWVIGVGYFIPGFRHLVGFAAGATRMRFSYFALYAYLGAFIWSQTFLTIGYFFGYHLKDWFH